MFGLFLAGLWIWQALKGPEPPGTTVSYSRFYDLVEEGKVSSVTIKGQDLIGVLRSAEPLSGRQVDRFHSTLPPQHDDDLLPLLREKSVEVYAESESQPVFLQMMLIMLPWVLIIGIWIWLSRRAQAMTGGPAGGGPLGQVLKGRTRRFDKNVAVSVRFDQIAGLKWAKQDLQEIVQFLKEPARFRRLGGKVPRGVLLVGPPGTGKTLLARAVAGESGVPFFSISGSEFIELFVGVGASRVRELFDEAKKSAPAIIFIDEIDAVGRARGAGLGGGHDEREQTLNQLLSEMDGFTRNDLIVVLAATNRPDVLDPALMRPGRFDRRVLIDRPESEARLAILRVHTKGKPLGDNLDLEDLARNTPGFSGADLENLVNEAALNATRRGADRIESVDFFSAFDKVVLGDPREGKLSQEEKHRVAVHETGHAVVAHLAPHAEPLQRITILPRGMSLGVTQQRPAEDRHIVTQPELESRLQVLVGGYAAERCIFGNVSSGAEDDLKKATSLAFKMVAHYGMSPVVGPVFHEHKAEHPFLGQRLATDGGGTSDATIRAIEEESRRLLTEAVEAAETTLEEHRDTFERLLDALLDRETLEQRELSRILDPETPKDEERKSFDEVRSQEAMHAHRLR